MSTSVRGNYHHGDLRRALMAAATTLMEAGETFSLRAVAREAGVSQTAPYRHFSDRDALEAALAVEGFRELDERIAACTVTDQPEGTIVAAALTYVNFALERPALFGLMFGQECDDANDERVLAAAELSKRLHDTVQAAYPQLDTDVVATALWATTHGLAFLHVDGKFSAGSAEEVEHRVTTSLQALLAGLAAVSASDLGHQ